jgi:hypothetical protein
MAANGFVPGPGAEARGVDAYLLLEVAARQRKE